MYYYLNGEIGYLDLKTAVIDCGGVGYKCSITLNTYKQISGKTRAKLFTYLSVREDAMELYGFADETEKAFFEMLLGVNGVGPKAALAVLSDMTPSEFSAVLATQDAKRLSKVKGIGAKTAQRIIIDLRDKIAHSDLPDSGAGIFSQEEAVEMSDAKAEAVEVLAALGYTRSDARSAVAKCPAENVNDLVKQALRLLSKLPAQRCARLAAVHTHDLRHARDLVRLAPALKGQKHIRPHQQQQLVRGRLCLKLAQSIHRVALSAAPKL